MATIDFQDALSLVERHAVWEPVGPYYPALHLPVEWFAPWYQARTGQTPETGLFQPWHSYPARQDLAKQLLAKQVLRAAELPDGL